MIKIGPVKFRRQAEQLWHWLVEQEVVRCRSLPLQKYEYSQPKVILCHLSLTNHVFANWFLFEEDDYDFDYQPRQMIPKHRLLLLERVNGTAPGQRFSCGFFYRRWKIYWIWWPQKPTPRIWTRAEKSERRKGGKSRKGGKRREKVEKSDLVMQLDFWQTCQNAIKCHEMISVHPMLNMWCMTNH